MNKNHKKAQILACVFVVSSAIFLIVSLNIPDHPEFPPRFDPPCAPGVQCASPGGGDLETLRKIQKVEEKIRIMLVVSGVSLLSSVGSFIALISTFILSWRKERREVESHRIDNDKKKLETEKLAFELEEVRRRQENS